MEFFSPRKKFERSEETKDDWGTKEIGSGEGKKSFGKESTDEGFYGFGITESCGISNNEGFELKKFTS
jgi:hypothetical protein